MGDEQVRSEQEDDEHFVDLFKREHNEQFYVLVKMHLSFLLNMTTEESDCFDDKTGKLKKWNIVPFSNKKSKQKCGQEATLLTPTVVNQVHQLINFLKRDSNLDAEGIFRRTGSLERQNDLKNLLLKGCTIDFDDNSYTVHDCASVLKGFLAELPEPVTTDHQFPVYYQIAESFRVNEATHETKILQSVQLLFLLLPKENKLLLRDLFELLHLVVLKESTNRMSPENLAKLFTLHLLCPRKIAPEILLKDCQILFGTVAFMIRKYPKLFAIPARLLLDFKSHYEQRNPLNDSIKGAAHTVFTFVDNKLTAKENEVNCTDAALAELYAHIQSLPDSSRKRKLVKQFNKQNGQGTPLQVIRSSGTKNKSLGDSIKKHMFHRKLLKNLKRSTGHPLRSSSNEDMLGSPLISHKTPSRGLLFCHNTDSSSSDDNDDDGCYPLAEKRLKTPVKYSGDSIVRLGKIAAGLPVQCLTSTPARVLSTTDDVFTPENHERKSMSPITRSTQRMPRAMQETMMTPRSRKPVLLVSGTNINNLVQVTPTLHEEEGVQNEPDNASNSGTSPKLRNDLNAISEQKLSDSESAASLSTNFKDYLNSRDMLTSDSLIDSTFSTRSDDFRSCENSLSDDQKPISDSMLYILDGNDPGDLGSEEEKELVLKPRQFDENGKPIVFETSF